MANVDQTPEGKAMIINAQMDSAFSVRDDGANGVVLKLADGRGYAWSTCVCQKLIKLG